VLFESTRYRSAVDRSGLVQLQAILDPSFLRADLLAVLVHSGPEEGALGGTGRSAGVPGFVRCRT
jgi:hypothetical protein